MITTSPVPVANPAPPRAEILIRILAAQFVAERMAGLPATPRERRRRLSVDGAAAERELTQLERHEGE